MGVRSRFMRGRLLGGAGPLLIPAAALAVHQLRYTMAYGPAAGEQLSEQGHSYLHSLVPWAILALAVGLSSFIRRMAQAWRTGEAGRLSRGGTSALWLLTACSLVLVYAIQESLEGLFASGHPAGASAVFGHGGWWAIPAAALVAAAVVAILRIGRSLLRAAVLLRQPRRRLAALRQQWPRSIAAVAARPLALAAAGRAPPASPNVA
jgi:hypothetical protein